MADPGDKAAVMGRVFDVGFGWGVIPKGYYLTMDDGGNCAIVVTRGKVDKTELVGDAEQQAIIKSGIDTGVGGELVLAKAHVDGVSPCTWHNLCLRSEGKKITAVVDGKETMTATSSYAGHGMAGLMAVKDSSRVSTPYFDNIDIRPIKGNDAVSSRPGIEPLY